MRVAVVGTDAVALGGLIASGAHALPGVFNLLAGALGSVWFAIQIWDYFTVRRLVPPTPPKDPVP